MVFCFVLCVSRTVIASVCFFLMIRRPPRSTLDRSSAASDVYKRQGVNGAGGSLYFNLGDVSEDILKDANRSFENGLPLSLIHISEPTRPY